MGRVSYPRTSYHSIHYPELTGEYRENVLGTWLDFLVDDLVFADHYDAGEYYKTDFVPDTEREDQP